MIRAITLGLAAAAISAASPALPLYFEPLPAAQRYLARGSGYVAEIRPDRLLIHSGADRVELRFAGAARTVAAEALEPQAGRSHYFTGSDRSAWRTDVPHFRRVRYPGIYRGIDAVYYGAGSRVEYDLVVHPGADPRAIEMAVDGASVSADGSLVVRTTSGLTRQTVPHVFQILDGRKIVVAGRYVNRGRGRFGFEVGAYRRDLPLVIDPVLTYSTFFGAEGTDTANAIAVDGAGNVYIAGTVSSSTLGGVLPYGGGGDAYVAKLNPSGTAVIYSAYIGGSATDIATGLAIDQDGSAYISGDSASTNFPVSADAYGRICCGVFVAKLNPAGNAIQYATFLGGGESRGIAVDASRSAYVVGASSSAFSTSAFAFQRSYAGLADGFVAKLNTAGTGVAYATLIGGAQADAVNAIAVDASGNAYLAGTTESPAFPATSAILGGATSSGKDAFVTKLTADGSQLTYSTLIGTTAADEARAITIDAAGNAYVAGRTDSTSFPMVQGSYLTIVATGFAPYGYALKLNPAGSGLVYSTYLGTGGADGATGIALDSTGAAYITGSTETGEFPTTPNAFQAAKGGGADAIVARVNAAGSVMLYATHLGGSSYEYGRAIAVDPLGNAYVTGTTASANFPVTSVVLQATKGAGTDAFVAKVDNSSASCAYQLSSNGEAFTPAGGSGTVHITTGNGCAWFSASNNSWITITAGASRVGSATVEFTVAANDSINPRNGSLTVAGQSYVITQPGASCTFTVIPTSATFDADGGIATVNVTAPAGCAWTAASNALWIAVNQGATGNGSGVVRYTVQQNTGASRTGSLTVAGTTFNVSQGGVGCSYSISPAVSNVGGEGAVGSVTVTAAAGCPWTASSNAAWITVPMSSGAGSGTVQYTVSPNASAARSGTVSIAGQTLTVNQSSANCVIGFNRNPVNVPDAGGATSVAVTASAGCTWSVTSSVSWIVPATTSGVGPGTLTFVVAPNTVSSSRTGFVLAGGQALIVTQSASGQGTCGFSLSATNLGVISSGQAGTLTLSAASASCAWTASSNVPWVQVYPLAGNGPGSITYTVYPNYTSQQRTGTAVIAGQTVTFMQLPSLGTATERLVGQMYFNFFGRIPSAPEVAFHAGPLDAGTPRAAWVNALFNSEEFNNGGRFIAGLYVGLLNRYPEFQGWLFQRNALATGLVNHEQLVANFLGSNEFLVKFGSPSNADFARLMYRNVLLREPSTDEVAFQSNALTAGLITRVQMASAFLSSPEFRQGTGPRLTAFLLYATLLMRDTSPAELSARAAQIQSGTPVANLIADFVASPEFNLLLQ